MQLEYSWAFLHMILAPVDYLVTQPTLGHVHVVVGFLEGNLVLQMCSPPQLVTLEADLVEIPLLSHA